MTFKQLITLRNFMIILCISMFVLLGQKAFLIADKIQITKEADRLYAAGDLISAENQYRLAAANHSILYMEEKVAKRLDELSPITAIRQGLNALVSSAKAQAATKDFTGFMKSYDTLLSLKATYMKPGGPYESYYRQLSTASGISDQFTTYFREFKEQFLAELAQNQSGNTSEEDTFKWNLLLIPDAYYGSAASKNELLASKFKSHDTAKLKNLAGTGNFSGMLESALSMMNAYSQHSYDAPWVLLQTESSGKIILNKDLEGNNITAFAGHAVAYRNFAGSANITSSKVLTLVDTSKAQLLKNAKRMISKGQYAEAIQLYGDLAPLEDTSSIIAATRLAWNIAEPVRLLPGGEEQNKYGNVISSKGLHGTKVIVAGTDSNGVLYYAAMNNDESVITLTGNILPNFESLRSLTFNDQLAASSGSGAPVVLAESEVKGGRTLFTAYEMKSDGISQLFSMSGDSYELQSDDSILVPNADLGDDVDGQTARYRKVDGSYQFAEIVQEYAVISASDVALHPFEKVSFHCEIVADNFGNMLAYSNGVYILLQGDLGSVTGNALVSGQYQNGYQLVGTDMGEQYVPVFVVESVGSMSFRQ
ncbi:hypothetical protein [Paenibacillus odorifer]|uniref:Uncharacterized protein n=1 Tax=Paenibacillus odorifer TaxID=189426 RepID=A0A1R0XWX6_9BACL|nr:hypothetical protein [Paenibacillus odorifer]OMD39467.1 hypothetical protein BSK52_15890 [Paenibacillus odorifer]